MGKSIRRFVFYLLVSWPLVLSVAAPLFAQDESEDVSKASWVMSYVLIILCVGLALAPICRPSRRGKDVKRG